MRDIEDKISEKLDEVLLCTEAASGSAVYREIS